MASNDKEAYYFSHDSNARNDDKILRLRYDMGWEGYGIYWGIIENLRDQPGYSYLITNLKFLAFSLATTEKKIKKVITEYELFKIEGDLFFSESLSERMNKKSKAGKKGAEGRWNSKRPENTGKDEKEKNAIASDSHNDRNAIGMPNKGKESKGKESKVKEIEKEESDILIPEIPIEDEKEKIPPIAPPPPIIPPWVNPNAIDRGRGWAETIPLPFESQNFKDHWSLWIEHLTLKGCCYKTRQAEELVLREIGQFDETFVIRQIGRAIPGDWKNLIQGGTHEEFKQYKKTDKFQKTGQPPVIGRQNYA